VSVRSAAIRVAVIGALFAAVVVLIAQLVPGAEQHLRNASPGWLALAIAAETAACAGYAALFHAVFSHAAHPLPPSRSAQIAVGELAGYALVPTGLGGPALRFWALRRGGMPLRTIAVLSVAHAPLFNAPYAAAAVTLGLGAAAGLGPGRAPLAVALAPIGLVAVATLGALAVTVAARSPRIARRSRRLRAILRIGPDGIREIPPLSRRPATLAGAFAYWAGDCAALVASFHACGGDPALGVVVLAYMLGQLGNLLPLPGGVGGVEPVMLGVLTASGVAAGLAAAAIVCYRAIALGLQGLAGSVAVVALTHRLRAPGGESDRTQPA
jgi:uncharacterized membrane protein YbhN (UPF0104 family)